MMNMKDMQKRCFLEVVYDITEPGAIKHFDIPPSTVGDWKDTLEKNVGWVDIGIQEDIKSVLEPFEIGIIIPCTKSDILIYSDYFAAKKIFQEIGGEEKDKSYYLLLNYSMFIKLAKYVLKKLPYSEVSFFNESMRELIKEINVEKFWVDVKIPYKKAKLFMKEKIGEVIIGKDEYPIKLNDLKVNDLKVNYQKKYPYRYILNSKSLYLLLKKSLEINEIGLEPDIHVHYAVGDCMKVNEKELIFYFSKLEI
jgi:hypothetical protein